jgi:hypothetical protein
MSQHDGNGRKAGTDDRVELLFVQNVSNQTNDKFPTPYKSDQFVLLS